MKSNYVNNKQLNGLSGLSGFTGVIQSGYATVRIIGKNPSGVTVQVQTDPYGAGLFRTPFACPDAFIAVRDAGSNALIGGTLVVTSRDQSCFGTANIRFQRSPSSGSIILELYKGGTTEWFESEATLEGVREGWAEFIAKSYPIALGSLQTSVDEGGVVQAPKEDTGIFDSIDIGGIGLGNTLKWTAILAAGGVSLYFLMPLLPVLQDGFENVAGFIKDEMNEIKDCKNDPDCSVSKKVSNKVKDHTNKIRDKASKVIAVKSQ